MLHAEDGYLFAPGDGRIVVTCDNAKGPSVGLRYRFGGSGIVSANAIVPLNDQGLRASVIPTLEIEYAF